MKFAQPTLPVIDPNCARDVGLRLFAARQARELSVRDVANHLKASDRQVRGLERGDHATFYNTKFYAKAADGYARFVELDIRPSAMLFVAATEAQLGVADISDAGEHQGLSVGAVGDTMAVTTAIRQCNVRKRLAFAALVVAVVVGGPLTLSSLGDAGTTEPVSTHRPAIAPMQIQDAAAMVVTDAATGVPSGDVVLTFNAPCWVKVVPVHGASPEKTYVAGESVQLQLANLQTLVVGNVRAVEMKAAHGNINLQSFADSGNNVVRISGAQIARLDSDLGR